MMRIVADENIVALDTYSEFGELIKLPGRSISAADVRDADALIVRSITSVNKNLLDGSRVRFVASATSGTNHLDLDWLAAAGITVTDAAGCNADAVVEYVFTAVCELIRTGRLSLRDKTFAVIGAGHVGGRLLRLLQRLGVRCVACDPFMNSDEFEFCTLEQALKADVISVHTPLTYTGDHPTFHLINAERIAMLKPGTVLINAARGEIVDNTALLLHLQAQPGTLLTVFDVWEAEPAVNPELLLLIDIATPHIAGYSVEAKLSASLTNFQSFVQHFKLTSSSRLPMPDRNDNALSLPPGLSLTHILSPDGSDLQVAEALCAAFAVLDLSQEFKEGAGTKDGAALFDELRKKLTTRHEYGLRNLA
jgi:erythronate-4-phosphate dehydrogenase